MYSYIIHTDLTHQQQHTHIHTKVDFSNLFGYCSYCWKCYLWKSDPMLSLFYVYFILILTYTQYTIHIICYVCTLSYLVIVVHLFPTFELRFRKPVLTGEFFSIYPYISIYTQIYMDWSMVLNPSGHCVLYIEHAILSVMH